MEIQDLEHWQLQLGLGLLLISYIQWKFHWLRCIAILSNASLIVYGLLESTADVWMWNGVQALVNVLFLVYLCTRRIRFDPDCEKLYRRVFAEFLTRAQFKRLKESCIKVKVVNDSRTDILRAGNPFTELVILGEVDSDNMQIQLQAKSRIGFEPDVLDNSLQSWSWLGCVEYIRHFSTELKEKVAYSSNPIDYATTVHALSLELPLVIYKISKNKLTALFREKEVGPAVYKAFMAKILLYTSHKLVEDKVGQGECFACQTQQFLLAENDPSSNLAKKFQLTIELPEDDEKNDEKPILLNSVENDVREREPQHSSSDSMSSFVNERDSSFENQI